MKPINIASRIIGVSSSTLRRWERRGVLPFRVGRNEYGRRIFTEDQISILVDIRGRMVGRLYEGIKKRRDEDRRGNDEDAVPSK